FDRTNGHAYSDEIPMETFVERERLKFTGGDLAVTYGLRVKMGQYFLKLHTPALRTKYLPAYLEHFGIETNKEADFRGQTDGLNLYIATKARAIDGGEIYNAIKDNSFSAAAGIE